MRTVLLVLAVSVVAADAKEDAKKDMDKLQGTWIGVSAEVNGRKKTDEEAQKIRLIFKGNKVTQKVGDIEDPLTYTLDPSTKPKCITVQDDKRVMKGIYTLEGDILKTSFVLARDKDYPGEFTGKEGFVLTTFKREKK
jgi:uncharacterized protein (TIGR03067 family)